MGAQSCSEPPFPDSASNRLARSVFVSVLAVAALAISACNSVTGAGDFKFREVEETEEDDDGSSGNVTPDGGGGAGGGGGGGATACVYPSGDIGTGVGQVLSESLTWQGYAENSVEVSAIKIADYLDCDGTKGINALLAIESGQWCANCDAEAKTLNSKMDGGWKEMGIRVLTLMIEDINYNPATTETAYQWKTDPSHNLTSTAVAADPNFLLAPPFDPNGDGSIGLPYILVIDPRTMQVVHTQEGFSPDHPELESLAEKNASGGSSPSP